MPNRLVCLMTIPGVVSAMTDAMNDDPVNHPAHYTQGRIEALDAIGAALDPKEFVGYLRGQVIKYMWRAPHKGKASEDYRKARFYLDMLISREEAVDLTKKNQ